MKNWIEYLKKKWLFNTTKSVILIVLLIVVFIGLNIFVKNLNLSSIDVTKEKLYSLSEESKEKIKSINDDVVIYFFGHSENDQTVELAKLYSKVNSKISVEVVDIANRPDLAEKYDITSNATDIVVQAPVRSKILTVRDLYSYDYSAQKEVDLTEQKLTNAIIDTTISKKPKIYYLTGHKETTDLSILTTSIENEVNETASLNLLTTAFPEDCDLLFIASPTIDFTEYEADLIIDYIQKGGKILWLNNVPTSSLPNVEKVLAEYGVSLSQGIVREIDSNYTLLNQPSFIIPNLSFHNITNDIITDGNIILFEAGKLNFADDDSLSNLSVTVNTLVSSSSTSYLRTDYTNTSDTASDSEETGPFTIGAELIKNVNSETNSTLVIYSNAHFVTDNTVSIGNYPIPAVNLPSNKDIILNSIAYLTNREDSITIRKDTSSVTYTATETQDTVVRIIIFTVPILIILTGFIIGKIRKRKK